MKNKIVRWFLQHTLTIACCILITGLGVAFLVWSSPSVTTIGEDITTRKLTAEEVSRNIGEVGASYIIYGDDNDGDGVLDVIYAKNGSTGNIDYSGTDASTVIQSAIDALTDGGKIFFKNGIYNLTKEISIDVSDRLHIQGEGWNTILQIESATSWVSGSSMLNVGVNGDNELIISDIHIWNNVKSGVVPLSFRSFYEAKIDRCKIVYTATSYGAAISMSADGAQITNSYLRGYPAIEGSGVYLKIADNFFLGGGDGIAISSGSGVIANNVFEQQDGIDITVTSGLRIEALSIVGNHFARGRIRIDGTEAANAHFIEIVGNSFDHGRWGGSMASDFIYLKAVEDSVIAGNVFNGAGYNSGNTIDYDSIELENTKNILITGNHFFDDQVSPTQAYSIREVGTTDYTTVWNNVFRNFVQGAILKVGSNSVFKHNQGYVTENSGTAILPAGSSSLNISHGLAGTPSVIVANATSTNVGAIAITDKNGTSFTITTSATSTQDVGIYWKAEM